MSYFEKKKKPRILLINFTTKEAQKFTSKGYSVELSYMGAISMSSPEPPSYVAGYYLMPRPPYEYDVFIVQTDMPSEGKSYKTNTETRWQINKDLKHLRTKLIKDWSLSVCFLGKESIQGSLAHAGLPQIQVEDADERDSSLEMTEASTFAIEELHELLMEFKDSVNKVNKYIVGGSDSPDSSVLYRIPVYVNEGRRIISEYGSGYSSNRGTTPGYVILPQFKDNANVALGILRITSGLVPELFSETEDEWISSSEFEHGEVKVIEKEIAKEGKKFSRFKKKKIEEAQKICNKLAFIKQILVSDDEHFEGEGQLSVSVAKVLKYLGFSVEVREEVKFKGKKREDIYIKDVGGYKALCEAKGTTRQNPSPHYITQVLSHLRRANEPELSGLLVVNYDYKTHPNKRSLLYGDSEDWFPEDADDIGVISTVDLYKIVIDVRREKLTKEDARAILKQANRIEYPVKKKIKGK